jgi:hypothetical protein
MPENLLVVSAKVREARGNKKAGIDDNRERGLVLKVEDKRVIVNRRGKLDLVENAASYSGKLDKLAQIPFSPGPGLGITGFLSGFGALHNTSPLPEGVGCGFWVSLRARSQ